MTSNSLSLLHRLAIALALLGLAYLFLQTRSVPVISGWGGGSANNSTGAIIGNAQPITGVANPQGRGDVDPDVPNGDPLGVPNTVMTQGYGVGSHAPANIWGAVDLAIDGNNDGQADVQASMNAPIYATHHGTIKLAPNSVPAGNHIWVLGEHFKTGYSHLASFAVQDGQTVERGDLIGYVGTTGHSSGPHLDYQVWKDGVNVNPLDYGALSGT